MSTQKSVFDVIEEETTSLSTETDSSLVSVREVRRMLTRIKRMALRSSRKYTRSSNTPTPSGGRSGSPRSGNGRNGRTSSN